MPQIPVPKHNYTGTKDALYQIYQEPNATEGCHLKNIAHYCQIQNFSPSQLRNYIWHTPNYPEKDQHIKLLEKARYIHEVFFGFYKQAKQLTTKAEIIHATLLQHDKWGKDAQLVYKYALGLHSTKSFDRILYYIVQTLKTIDTIQTLLIQHSNTLNSLCTDSLIVKTKKADKKIITLENIRTLRG